ncbi:hypothetical protein BU17DRAFT_64809 [Hysterangium stoloniferum]|nr:hypothetical protein BU17DRAFT_64809 [Hysterangium stoloniferum]
MAAAQVSHPKVWFVAGAPSILGSEICRVARARGDLVIATAATQQAVDRLSGEQILCIKIDSDMSFTHIREKVRWAVGYFGKVDFMVNCPDFEHRQSTSSNSEAALGYYTNAFSYTTIQITKAVSEQGGLRYITVIAPYGLASNTQLTAQSPATAQILVAEHRYKGCKVSIVDPWSVSPNPGTDYGTYDGTEWFFRSWNSYTTTKYLEKWRHYNRRDRVVRQLLVTSAGGLDWMIEEQVYLGGTGYPASTARRSTQRFWWLSR